MPPVMKPNSAIVPSHPLLRRAAAPLVSVARSVADLLVPPICVGCREPLARHGTLCAACWSGIDFIRPPLCERLGLPFPFDAGANPVSSRALATPPVYGRARAVARHTGVMRDLVHHLKYNDQHHGLRLFARLMRSAGQELLADAELLIPVPLARVRLWRRGFNQAALIAHALSRLTAIPCDPLLVRRTRSTKAQVGLPLEERRRNVAGAFAISPAKVGRVRGRRIVLIDDVITTGSTVEAVTRVLLKAGAQRVDVLALTLVADEIAMPG